MNTFAAILIAAIPTAIYSLLIWWLDRYEKEPLWLLAVAFLWGSLPAIGMALLFELGLERPLAGSPLGPDLTVWGLAPVVEEPAKALALVGLYVFARGEFDGPLDGIVYGALIGFGFSMTENVLYYLASDTALSALFWVRGVVFGMNHAFFTSIVGLALGAVRYRRARALGVGAFALGLAVAILFHGLHNYVGRFQLPGLLLSWLVQSGGVLVVLAITVLAWRNERGWIEQELGDEVRAGILTTAEYAEVASPARRVRRQIAALMAGGWDRYRRVRRLHHLATELAFCKSQLRLDDRFSTCDERDQLRRELLSVRNEIARDEAQRVEALKR
jgi:RsiW-degrading membrane proteinase PrsW (M82 family)